MFKRSVLEAASTTTKFQSQKQSCIEIFFTNYQVTRRWHVSKTLPTLSSVAICSYVHQQWLVHSKYSPSKITLLQILKCGLSTHHSVMQLILWSTRWINTTMAHPDPVGKAWCTLSKPCNLNSGNRKLWGQHYNHPYHTVLSFWFVCRTSSKCQKRAHHAGVLQSDR